MTSVRSLSDVELMCEIVTLVHAERACAADVIEHLIEIDRRNLYLDQACSSLTAYCIERLGYSEDEASKRVRIARLARRRPGVLEELRRGAVHMTGLLLLAPYLEEIEGDELLIQARNKSKAAIEKLIAEWFPKPDVADRVRPVEEQISTPGISASGTASTSASPGAIRSGADHSADPAGRIKPLSSARWSVQFTTGDAFHEKLERARELLSHAVPNGDTATILERALDALLERETKKREGAGRTRRKRALQAGSRHIPVDIARAVRERDGKQCTFVDAQGRRCTGRRFLTIEHKDPFALGGEPTVENLCLLCAPHNHDAARKVFGDAYVEAKISERRESDALAKRNGVIAQTQSALCAMGFSKAQARTALQRLANTESILDIETTLRASLALLVPSRNGPSARTP